MTLEKFVAVMRRQWAVALTVLLLGALTFVVLWPQFRTFTATATMLAAAAPAGEGAVLDPQRDPIASAVSINDLQALATSDIILGPVAQSLQFSPHKTAKFPSEVRAKPVFNSDILPISVTDADADTAVAAANAVATGLAAYSERIATGRYDKLIANLQGQITARRRDLASIDRRIQSVSAGDFYVTPETGTSAIDTRLISLSQQEQQLDALVRGDEAAAAITAQEPAISHALAKQEIITQDPAVAAQRAQLGKDISQLNLGLASYSLNFPGLRGYIKTVAQETALVSRAESRSASNPLASASYVAAEITSNKARATLAADSAQLVSVREQLAGLQAHLTGSTGEGSQIAQLRRARAAGEDVYTDLSQRLARANADRAQAESIGSVVVIDHARAAGPALFGRPEILGVAIAVIFLWLAITLAFLVDGADDRLRTSEALERLYGKPVFTPVG